MKYTTYNRFTGYTIHADEVKGYGADFTGTSGGTTRVQAMSDAENLARLDTLASFEGRMLGTALRIAGPALAIGVPAYTQYQAFAADGYQFGPQSQAAASETAFDLAGMGAGAVGSGVGLAAAIVMKPTPLQSEQQEHAYMESYQRFDTEVSVPDLQFADTLGIDLGNGPLPSLALNPPAYSDGGQPIDFGAITVPDPTFVLADTPTAAAPAPSAGPSVDLSDNSGSYTAPSPPADTNVDSSGNNNGSYTAPDYSGGDDYFDLGSVFNLIGDVFDFLFPVVLDIAGKGIDITPVSESNAFFDMAGDGYQHHTAWIGAGNGILAFDADGDGKIDQRNEVVFTDWDPTATSDMQALRDVFDTDNDGSLDAGDAQFASFKILYAKIDGTTAVYTLAQAGVAAIDLTPDKTKKVLADGSSIDGETTFTHTNGTTGTAATVTLASEARGHALRTATTRNADGSTTIDHKELDPDGHLAGEITSTASADGLTNSAKFDSDGDGVADTVQTDTTVVAADGGRTATVSNANAAGILLDRTVTTTSADGKTVTIARDGDGNGVAEQSEIDATAADTSTSVTVTNLNPNGSVRDRTLHTTSADGATGTTQSDLDGNGVYDVREVDATVVSASDHSRTQTVSATNADGSLRTSTVTISSADGLSQTVKSNVNGDRVYDLTRVSTIVRNGGGTTTTTSTDTNADGTLRASLSTTITGDGLSTTTRSDADGNGTIDLFRTDATVADAAGNRTQTISEVNVRGALIGRTVIVKGADGVARTTSVDADGNGKYDSVDKVMPAANGTVTETVSSYAPDGVTLKSRSITTTTPGGLTKTVQSDMNGDGAFERTASVTTVQNADGSATVTTADRSASGALLDRTVVNTSADGLTQSSLVDSNGDGTLEATISAFTVLNADGTRTTNRYDWTTDGTVRSRTVTTLSADRNTTTIQADTEGDGTFDRNETIAKQANGSTADFVTVRSRTGALVSTTITQTSATGLSITVQSDVDGNATIDATTTDLTVLNNDGSRTDTVSVLGPGGVLRNSTVTTTSATGLTTTTTSDADGNGVIDLTTSDVTVLTNDGGRTRIVKQIAGGVALNMTTTTTSANGLSIRTVGDANGDGSSDAVTTDLTTLNADGTKTETLSHLNHYSALFDQTVTTTSEDGHTVTTARNLDGYGAAENTETVAVQANGSVVDTVRAVDASGVLLSRSVKTTAANGLSWTSTLDANGDGVTDETQSDVVAVNADGSTTETSSDRNTAFNIQPGTRGDNSTVVTTTSADGLTRTTTTTGFNQAFALDNVTRDTTVINSDGSTSQTRTVTATDAGGQIRTLDSALITTSAHGTSHSVQVDTDGDGLYDAIDTSVREGDGSRTDYHTQKNGDGSIFRADATSTSANGRYVAVQSDTNGDGAFDRIDTTTLNADGSKVEAIRTTTAAGTVTAKATATTSADGRSRTTKFDSNGDGIAEFTETLISVINSNGSTTATLSHFNVNQALRDRVVTTTSANGFSIAGTIDLNGDGVTDETSSNKVVLNADGSRSVIAQTFYADGTQKSSTVTTTSANGLDVTTNENFNSDAIADTSQSDHTASSGAKTSSVAYAAPNGAIQSVFIRTTSADGRQQTTIRDFNGDGIQDATGTVSHVADGNGSYDVADQGPNAPPYEGNHIIDQNGVDAIVILVAGAAVYSGRKTVAREAEELALVTRACDTVLDRDLTPAEREGQFSFSAAALVASLLAGPEFSQKYGTLTNAEFVERLEQNAYGRSAQLSEESSWLSQLNGGTVSRADLVHAIAESPEHLTVGNTHAVTNNSQNFSGTLTLDRTTDTQVAADIARRLFAAALSRNPTATELTSWGQKILSGSESEAQVAADMLTSVEFTNYYGTLSNSAFVTDIFTNALQRAPTAVELQSWTSALAAGVTRADVLDVVAQSPDHAFTNFVRTGTGATLTARGASDVFMYFNPFGRSVITNFAATGPAHDVLSLPAADFASIAAVLAHTQDNSTHTAAVITLDANNSITLNNVTTATLQANQADFCLHA